jgi:hypothetical protein
MRVPCSRYLSASLTFIILTIIGQQPVKASPVLLTFDDLMPGRASHFTDVGIEFATGNSTNPPDSLSGLIPSVTIEASDSATSPPNIAVGRFSNFPPPEDDPRFRDLIATFTPFRVATDYVSFDIVGTRPGGDDPWIA